MYFLDQPTHTELQNAILMVIIKTTTREFQQAYDMHAAGMTMESQPK